MRQRQTALAAPALVEESDPAPKRLRILDGCNEPDEHATEPRVEGDAPTGLDTHGVGEQGSSVLVAGTTIAEQGDLDRVDRQSHLAVLLVAPLLDTDGHVGTGLLVTEGQNRTAGKGKHGQGLHIDVGTWGRRGGLAGAGESCHRV